MNHLFNIFLDTIYVICFMAGYVVEKVKLLLC